MYVLRLHQEIPYGLTLRYWYDLALTASADSYCRNVQCLKGQYAILKSRGSRLGDTFSIPKTQLIHSCTNMDTLLPSLAPIHIDGLVLHPKHKLRWLGHWFTPSLSTTQHFTKRLAKRKQPSWRSKGSPPSDRPPPLRLPPFGGVPASPHHKLLWGSFLSDGSHGEKVSGLLAQVPGMVYKLFRL